MNLYCGVDVGGTKVLGLAVDSSSEGPQAPIVPAVRRPTPAGGDAVLDTVVSVVTEVVDTARQAGHDIAGVGVGAPGLVDREGTLRFAPNLPGVVDQPIVSILSDRLGLPVVADNDATAATWAEFCWGAAKGTNHALMFTLGTGIGGGVVAGGQLQRGAEGFAGEPGHMVVDPNGPFCPCGRRGCWERFASGSGLARIAREAAIGRRADRVVELGGGDAEAVRGEHVTAAAREGDREALEIIDRFGWWIALGIANLMNVLDSEIVVIGGGLVEEGDLLLDPVRQAYVDLVFASERRPVVPIVAAELGEHAGAIGAALLAGARTASSVTPAAN